MTRQDLNDAYELFRIAGALRSAVERASGEAYIWGVLSTDPPSGYVATHLGVNLTSVAEGLRGVKAVVIVVPPVEADRSEVEFRLLRVLEGLEPYRRAVEELRKVAVERARMLRRFLETGNESVLDDVAKMSLEGRVFDEEGKPVRNFTEMAEVLRGLVESLLGKPLSNATDEELTRALPYTIGEPMLPFKVGGRDTYFGIPSMEVIYYAGAYRGGVDLLGKGRRIARLVAEAANCTSVVLYVSYTREPGYYAHDIAIAEAPAMPSMAGDDVSVSPRDRDAILGPRAALLLVSAALLRRS